MITVINSEEETYLRTKNLLTSQTPCFLSRIGGSDTEAVMSYCQDPSNSGQLIHFMTTVMEFNGFYTKDIDPTRSYIQYIDTLKECYQRSDNLFVGGWSLLRAYYPQRIGYKQTSSDTEFLEQYKNFVNSIFENKNANFYAYDFVERVISNKFTFFSLLSEILPGKRVLIVSPFSRSAVSQQGKRHGLFKNYDYPEFELVTYDTPITYAGLPQEMYPDESWQVTADRLKSGICNLDFDIALLSCASYALPLGIHIRDVCGKHAVYVGGCLQLFLGIMGRRWSGLPYFMDQMHPENFVRPIEGDRYQGVVKVDGTTPADAFGAYF